jgi:hypothetical protein
MKRLFLILAAFAAWSTASSAPLPASPTAVILADSSQPVFCPEIYQPVCGTDPNGTRRTYSNACFARIAKAVNVTPGECSK